MAGDAQMDPADLPALLDPVVSGEMDYAKGNRLFTGDAWNQIPRVRYPSLRQAQYKRQALRQAQDGAQDTAWATRGCRCAGFEHLHQESPAWYVTILAGQECKSG